MELLLFVLLTFGILSIPSASQSCYYASGKQAGTAYIPCDVGNGQFQTCCGIGHLCLSDNACWDPKDNVTYLYGCTDSTYQDSTCPAKCNLSQLGYKWSGLSYCNGTSNEWVCCPTEGDFPKSVAPCPCPSDPASRQVAFAGPATLQALLSLPQTVGGSTSYFPGVAPPSSSIGTALSAAASSSTSTPSPLTSSVSTSTAMSTGSSITTTPTPSPSFISAPSSTNNPSTAKTSSGLSSSTKTRIGLGLGIPLGLILLTLLLWSLVMCAHRRRQRNAPPPIEDQIRPQSALLARQSVGTAATGSDGNEKTFEGLGHNGQGFGFGGGRQKHQNGIGELEASANEVRSPVSTYFSNSGNGSTYHDGGGGGGLHGQTSPTTPTIPPRSEMSAERDHAVYEMPA